MTARERLAARFRNMEANGLKDVKFDLDTAAGAPSLEVVCAEVESLYSAVERGHFQVLDFGDSRR